MATVTLAQMATRVRQTADLEVDGGFISAAELNGHINRACWALDDMLHATWEGYFTKEVAVNLSGGSHLLPTDFYKLVGVDVKNVGGYWFTLQPFAESSRAAMRNRASGPAEGTFYQVRSGTLVLLPALAETVQAMIVYYPQMPALVLDTDTRNYPNGWEQWAVLQAAMLCLAKEERDSTAVEKLWALEDKRIRDSAPMRQMQQPGLNDTESLLPRVDGVGRWGRRGW